MCLKRCTMCKIEKERTEFNKARRERDGLMFTCRECGKILDRQRRLKDPEKEKARKDKYRREHMKERNLARQRWAKENPEKIKEYRKRTYLKNKEKENFKALEYAKNNRGIINALSSKRKAQLRKAMVGWGDLNKIREIYIECNRITKETGIEHHVDHIIPITSKYVCGLHVENNLQILTGSENCSKQNSFKPG